MDKGELGSRFFFLLFFDTVHDLLNRSGKLVNLDRASFTFCLALPAGYPVLFYQVPHGKC
jgi:hypothetical protein